MSVPSIIRKPLRAAYRKVLQLNFMLCKINYQNVFILGHIRSGSTLLTHILASHSEFECSGERHVYYRTTADLSELAIAMCIEKRTLKLDATYIVDQINHDLIPDHVLISPRIYKCVILIRSPEAALQSIIFSCGIDEQAAFDQYIDRLKTLSHYGTILSNRALLIEYDDLVSRTKETLARLADFFGVTQPFKPDYSMHRTTGIVGDPSENIWSGRIFKTQPHRIGISSEALTKASIAFQECRQRLLSTVQSL